MREAGKDWLVDLLGREQEGAGRACQTHARRCNEQAWSVYRMLGGASMAELLTLRTLGKVYYCTQPAGVQTQHLFPSLYLYFLPPFVL